MYPERVKIKPEIDSKLAEKRFAILLSSNGSHNFSQNICNLLDWSGLELGWLLQPEGDACSFSFTYI